MKQRQPKRVFICQACGYSSQKWMGRCPDCGNWNSMVEEWQTEKATVVEPSTSPISIRDVTAAETGRFTTNLDEFDRVLGGGVVPGAVVLIGGDPGVGKSTLLLQVSEGLVRGYSGQGGKGFPVLYITAEESVEQVKMRADRIGISSSQIFVLSETRLESIIHHIKELQPRLVVIDSIQTIYTDSLSSAPGTVAQVRECSARLTLLAKQSALPMFIIGHVTKEGAIAGPRVLEHIVDTVLYFEGDKYQAYRILRAVKNRFGSTNEIGIFEMTDTGLREVLNPSELFLSPHSEGTPGTILTVTIEGTRPLLVEIQALVSPTVFGMPRRASIGFDLQRLNLLIAVVEKIGGVQLGVSDVYLNVVGGLRIYETAVDLAVASAIVSSFKNIPINRQTVVIGEVGLTGEVRPVSQIERRIKEAKKLGIRKAILPASVEVDGIELIRVNRVTEVFENLVDLS